MIADVAESLLTLVADYPIGFAASVIAASMAVLVWQPLDRWRYRKVPTTFVWPILGHLPEVAAGDATLVIDKTYGKFTTSKVFQLWMGPAPWIVIRDPDLAHRLMLKFTHRPDMDFMSFKAGQDRKVWNSLLLSLKGAKWRFGRRATEAALMHPKALAAQMPYVAKATAQLVEVLDRYAQTGEPFNVQECTYAMAMDAVGWAAFGVELYSTAAIGSLQAQGDVDAVAQVKLPDASVKKEVDVGATGNWWYDYPVGSPEFGRRLVQCAITCMRAYEIPSATVYTPLNMLFPWLRPVWEVLSSVAPDKNIIKEKQGMAGLAGACKVMMEKWKQQQLMTKEQGDKPDMSRVSEDSFLARLLSGKDFSVNESLEDYEVMALAVTSVIGGYDTTGTSIAMSLRLLSMHPEAQIKVQEELDEVLKGREPTMQDLEDLPWVHAVFKESLRLGSPVSAAVREITEPMDIGDGIVLPKDTAVYFPVYSYHHDPEIWPRVNDFLPERHLQPGNESLMPKTPNAFMPFGHGGWMCVGYKFATLETRMALARLLQKYTFTPAPGEPEPKFGSGLTFSPNKVVLCVQRRK